MRGRAEALRFGLVGHPVSHSISAQIHEKILHKLDLDGIYVPLDMSLIGFDEHIQEVIDLHDGFNVTVPFKKAIIPHLESVSEEAAAIGAVNTVCGHKGFNTDVLGFLESLPQEVVAELKQLKSSACILGAGGAARAVMFALASLGVEHFFVVVRDRPESRKRALELVSDFIDTYPYADVSVMSEKGLKENALIAQPTVVINTTPAGMYPATRELPLSQETCDYLFSHLADTIKLVYDVIYNPVATSFMLRASSYGIPTQNGLEMLVLQAIEAEKIWNPDRKQELLCFTTDGKRTEFYQEILDFAQAVVVESFNSKILVTGFMGAGKSSIGALLQEALPPYVSWFDLDKEVELKSGATIKQIFETVGEDGFRDLEKETLKSLLAAQGPAIISTGGGTVVQPYIPELLRDKSVQVIYLDGPFNLLLSRIKQASGERPLASSDERLLALYQERLPQYQALADLTIDVQQPLEQCFNKVMDAIKLVV